MADHAPHALPTGQGWQRPGTQHAEGRHAAGRGSQHFGKRRSVQRNTSGLGRAEQQCRHASIPAFRGAPTNLPDDKQWQRLLPWAKRDTPKLKILREAGVKG